MVTLCVRQQIHHINIMVSVPNWWNYMFQKKKKKGCLKNQITGLVLVKKMVNG